MADADLARVAEGLARLVALAVRTGANPDDVAQSVRFYAHEDTRQWTWVLSVGVNVGKHPHPPMWEAHWESDDGMPATTNLYEALAAAEQLLPSDVYDFRTNEHRYPAAWAKREEVDRG